MYKRKCEAHTHTHTQTHSGVLFCYKEENMSFAENWMELEIMISTK
jgi:hypothetical protein